MDAGNLAGPGHADHDSAEDILYPPAVGTRLRERIDVRPPDGHECPPIAAGIGPGLGDVEAASPVRTHGR